MPRPTIIAPATNSSTNRNKLMRIAWLILLLLPHAALAIGQARYVETAARPGSFPIAQDNACAAIYVDSADYPGVIRAAGDLQADIHRVTGCTPEMVHDSAKLPAHTIVIGSIEKSPLVSRLIDTKPIAGKWEDFLIEPAKGALVIAGSDKRGTIYGIYDLSEQIGVSPWYWWADVPIAHHDALVRKSRPLHGGRTGGEISRHFPERRSPRTLGLDPREVRRIQS